MNDNYTIQINYPEPYPACACGCSLTWVFRPDSFHTEGMWQCNTCASIRRGLPHPKVRKIYDLKAMQEERDREEREAEEEKKRRNKRRREKRAAEKKQESIEREYYSQRSIAEANNNNSGPEECPKCGDDHSAYLGGYCFNCGVYRTGGKKSEPGENRDAYDYMQMSYGTRVENWMRLR